MVALSKSPSHRFQTGAELMDAIEVALEVPVQTAPYLPQDIAGAEIQAPRLSQTSLPEIVAEKLEATAPSIWRNI
jgi:hypothetical protein